MSKVKSEKINSMNIHSQYNLEAATPWCWHSSSDCAFRILLVQGLAQAKTTLKFGIFVQIELSVGFFYIFALGIFSWQSYSSSHADKCYMTYLTVFCRSIWITGHDRQWNVSTTYPALHIMCISLADFSCFSSANFQIKKLVKWHSSSKTNKQTKVPLNPNNHHLVCGFLA